MQWHFRLVPFVKMLHSVAFLAEKPARETKPNHISCGGGFSRKFSG